jgi:hypothetical protein
MTHNILPDTRAKRPTGGKFFHGKWWNRISCANCSKDGGYVPEENMTFAFWLCDYCYETHGTIAGTMVLPDEVFWAKVNNQPLQSPADLLLP